MRDNETSTYSIEETYQILENNFSLDKPLGFYRSKYDSLEQTTADILLKTIETILNDEKLLVQQLTPKVVQGLINPNYKSIADQLILTINSKNPPLLTPAQIKTQLSEFIDFSKLAYYFSRFLWKFPWKWTSHIPVLQKFASLIKLKFNLLLDHLGQFLISTTEEYPTLIEIAETLINDYFPVVASANYPVAGCVYLALNRTNPTELKHTLLNNDIPVLREKLDIYHKNITQKKLKISNPILSESDDDDDFQSCIDEEEDGIDEFWDAEGLEQGPLDNEDILSRPNTILIITDKNPTETRQNFIQLILTWLKKWIQRLRHPWFRNLLNNDISIIDKNSSDKDKNTSAQSISPEILSTEKAIDVANLHLNEAHLTSLGSNPNAFYRQETKTGQCSPVEILRHEI